MLVCVSSFRPRKSIWFKSFVSAAGTIHSFPEQTLYYRVSTMKKAKGNKMDPQFKNSLTLVTKALPVDIHGTRKGLILRGCPHRPEYMTRVVAIQSAIWIAFVQLAGYGIKFTIAMGSTGIFLRTSDCKGICM